MSLRLPEEGDCRVLRTRNDSVGALGLIYERRFPRHSDGTVSFPSLLKPHPTFPTMGKTL